MFFDSILSKQVDTMSEIACTVDIAGRNLERTSFSTIFEKQVKIDMGRQLVRFILSPDLNTETTLATFKHDGNIPDKKHALQFT